MKKRDQREEISPPPIKRIKKSTPPQLANHAPSSRAEEARARLRNTARDDRTRKRLRIFAWNINGITPFVESYLQQQSQKHIDSFFTPSPRKRKRQRRSESPEEAGNDGERVVRVKGKPSLRGFLYRHHWPHMLLLQEVKINPRDVAMKDATCKAVNDPLDLPETTSEQHETPPMTETWARIPSSSSFLSDGGPSYVVHFNLPRDLYNAQGFGGKVYGIASIVRADFVDEYVEKIRGVDWDLEGRIHVIETKELYLPLTSKANREAANAVPHQKTADSSCLAEGIETTEGHHIADLTVPNPRPAKLAIIHVYAVNGTSNPYRSPATGEVIGTRHDRKLAVHQHLLQESLKLESQGFSVVIAGDLNIARGPLDGHPNLRTFPAQHCLNRADFNEKFFATKRDEDDEDRFGGIDTFRYIHGDERSYSYRPRTKEWGTSGDRVDLIITSRDLEEHVMDAGILDTEIERGPSDHCPIWLELG